MSRGFSLDTLQDKQMLYDFIEAKRGGICGIMGDRIVNNSNGNKLAKHRRCGLRDDQRSIWYIDANNLYGYAMMQKLPYKDFKFTTTSLDYILITPYNSDQGC